jgi:hypothetical protein
MRSPAPSLSPSQPAPLRIAVTSFPAFPVPHRWPRPDKVRLHGRHRGRGRRWSDQEIARDLTLHRALPPAQDRSSSTPAPLAVSRCRRCSVCGFGTSPKIDIIAIAPRRDDGINIMLDRHIGLVMGSAAFLQPTAPPGRKPIMIVRGSEVPIIFFQSQTAGSHLDPPRHIMTDTRQVSA